MNLTFFCKKKTLMFISVDDNTDKIHENHTQHIDY